MSIILPQLSLDIIINILSRLPVKPLFRFKCVCKLWLSLISNNPQFAKLHLHYAKQDTAVNRYRLFLSTHRFQSIDHDAYCNGENFVIREHGYPETAHELEFIGSCNGLIAIARNSHSYIIWNPTTGDFRVLPTPNLTLSGEIFSGFGYDSRLDDYKVVRGIVASTSRIIIKMDVFNLKGDTWRSIEDLSCNIFVSRSPVSVNECLHWLVPIGTYHSQKWGIVSFDFAKEKFVENVEVPDHVAHKFGSRIQRVGHNLCVSTDWYICSYEAWIMKRDGKEISWSKLCCFNNDPLPRYKYRLELLWVAKNEKVLFDLDGRELLLYNSEDQSSSQYDIDSDKFEVITYIQSLISPNFI